jgi:hypothetical protein
MKFLACAKFSVFTLLSAAFLMVGHALAQELAEPLAIEVTGEDRIAAATITASRYHLLLTKQAKAAGNSADSPNVKLPSRTHAAVAKTALPSPPANTFFYPDDVEKTVSTGKTIVTSQHHPIYINCPSPSTPTTCWGNPAAFLVNLDASSMIHLSDQYTGSTTNGRYTVGTQYAASVTIYPGTSGVPTLGENDLLGLVHSAAKLSGSGYGHIYHLFIPKGVDTCMDEGPCYSPDNANTFVFCAYHYSVKFSDIASPVYYTVEPYQGPLPAPLLSCAVPTGTPNGQLVDSMATSLLHETFETITDPDINTGYRAVNSSLGEVGDLCEGFLFGVAMNSHTYAVQAIYSDKYEACATTP